MSEQTQPANPASNQQLEFIVTGMTCGHCQSAVAQALEAIAGVASVEVDLAAGKARVAGAALDPAVLIAAVVAEGYSASLAS
jgi:copper chaperone